MKQELKNNPNVGKKREGISDTQAGKKTFMQNKFFRYFNSIYDFSSRIFKFALFLVIIFLIVFRLPNIDWSVTSNNLINNYTPFQTQSLQFAHLEDTTEKDTVHPTKVSNPTLSQQNSSSKPHKAMNQTAKDDYLAIYQFGQLVFTVDKPYTISGDLLTFDKLLLKGKPDYDKLFLYGGIEIRITNINQYIGLLVTGNSVEGPVLRGVTCKVIHK